jgi:excisionase family DNA binding protein
VNLRTLKITPLSTPVLGSHFNGSLDMIYYAVYYGSASTLIPYGVTMMTTNNKARTSATVEDVAEHFGVSSRTVRRWLKHTEIPHSRVGRTIRFNLDEVREWARPTKEVTP